MSLDLLSIRKKLIQSYLKCLFYTISIFYISTAHAVIEDCQTSEFNEIILLSEIPEEIRNELIGNSDGIIDSSGTSLQNPKYNIPQIGRPWTSNWKHFTRGAISSKCSMMLSGSLYIYTNNGQKWQLYKKLYFPEFNRNAYSNLNQFVASSKYAIGNDIQHKDINKAISWFKSAAVMGYPEAGVRLGDIYSTYHSYNKEFHQDIDEAKKWYELAVNQNPRNTGVIYSHYEQDYKFGSKIEALYWLKLAAKMNNTKAIENLAMHYVEGKIIEKNDQEAVALFRKSISLGQSNQLSTLTYRLGMMYGQGRGVLKNKVVAYALLNYIENNYSYLHEDGNPTKALSKEMTKEELTTSEALLKNMKSEGILQAIDNYMKNPLKESNVAYNPEAEIHTVEFRCYHNEVTTEKKADCYLDLKDGFDGKHMSIGNLSDKIIPPPIQGAPRIIVPYGSKYVRKKTFIPKKFSEISIK